ncbi:MAG TPA: AAA family ATPase [Candidatus Limnocylindrales bacterium]|nr:AAA family ATPase [Candidatus Limnocylindrales bacterium]
MGERLEGRGFVGRAGELARLRAAYMAACAGRGTGVLLGGEAGVGKTRLIEAFTDAVRDEATVLIGACLEFAETGPPYGPFVEALRTLVRSAEPAQLATFLGPWRPELARLLPELTSRRLDTAPPEFDRSAQARLFEIVLGLIERVAHTRPLVLVIEDVHWADRSSRDLLTFLVRNLRAAPVLIVMSVRSDELHARHPMLPVIAELEREPHVDRIEVPRFVREELGELIAGILGRVPDASMVDAVHARSDGNAFFATQLVAAAAEQHPGSARATMPPRLRDVLLARIAALSDRAQDVLRAGSAAGRLMDEALLATVLGVPGRELRPALRELHASGILVDDAHGPQDGGYAFQHTLLREVVYGELVSDERRMLHAGFAAALAERGEVAGQAVGPGDLAYHWDAAREYEQALPVLVAAGKEAEAAYAFGEAFHWYDRALQLWGRVGRADEVAGLDHVAVLQRAAEMQLLLGAPERAIELARAAIELIDQQEPGARDLLRAGHLHDRLRWFLWEAGDRAAASDAVRRSVSMVPADPPTPTRARALAQLAAIDLHAGRYAQAVEGARVAVATARAASGRSEEALALGVLGWARAMTGHVEEGIARYREGLSIALELRGVEGIALGYAELARLLDATGLADRALEASEEGLAITRRLGLERTYGGVMAGHVANALFELGRWDEAEAVLMPALALDPSGRSGLWLLVNRARLNTARGDAVAASADLDRARELQRGLLGAEFGPKLLAATGELALARGQLEAVHLTWEDAWRPLAEDAAPDPAVLWLGAVALRAVADAASRARIRRDRDGLDEALARVAAILGRFARVDRILGPVRPFQGRRAALAALVRAEAGRARAGNRPEAWAATAEAWSAIGVPFPAAYARYREAEAVLAGGDPRVVRETAEGPLREAHAVVRRLRARPLELEIETLARYARIDLGVSPAAEAGADRTAAGGIGFTEREHEVLRLVAGGWSNQQIADALYISRKTASVHVSNILGKLGVTSRGEAAAIAHRIGLGRDAPPPPGSESVAERGNA